MSGSRAAIRYAKAVISFAKDQNKLDQVYNDMNLIVSTLDENIGLQTALSSPITKASIKKDILKAVFKGKINNISEGLVDLLIDNKRIAILKEVALQYQKAYDIINNKEVAKVTTAVELTEDLNKKILAKVKELTGKEAVLETEIDPSILGGFVLRIGDIQYDASIANKLNELRRDFNKEDFVTKI